MLSPLGLPQDLLELLLGLGRQLLEVVQEDYSLLWEVTRKRFFPQGEVGGVLLFQQLGHSGGLTPTGPCGEEKDFIVGQTALKRLPQPVWNGDWLLRHIIHPFVKQVTFQSPHGGIGNGGTPVSNEAWPLENQAH